MPTTTFYSGSLNSYVQLTPRYGDVWAGSALMGFFMVAIAYALMRNLGRRKSAWIVGGIGTAMVLTSGAQFLFGIF